MKCPGLEISSSSSLFLRGFSGSGQTDRLKQDRRIQQLSNEGKQFLHWVVEPRVCLKAWWENFLVAAFPIAWMRVGPVAFDQLQLGGRTFGGRSLGTLVACIALTSGCWFIGRYNTIGLSFGLRLPTFSFTILCNNVALLSGVSWFSRKPLPRIALENQLKGALMDLKNHSMKSTTVSINREWTKVG